MKKYILVFAAMCLLLLPATGCAEEVGASSNVLDDVVITLERQACFGFCPVYTLTIYGDGTVVYDGKDFVTIKDRVEATITKEKIEQLVQEFEAADYYSLDDNYTERTITDAQTVITAITIDGKTKAIEHYHGDFTTPENLTELENKIDEIVNSSQWVD
jgi:hypothetical protein